VCIVWDDVARLYTCMHWILHSEDGISWVDEISLIIIFRGLAIDKFKGSWAL
jgi:hypothetical protein